MCEVLEYRENKGRAEGRAEERQRLANEAERLRREGKSAEEILKILLQQSIQ